MKIIIAFTHLINFVIVALQRIEQGQGTIGQLHHDLQVAGRAVSMKNTAELQNLLDCFCPMIHNRHWDLFVEFLLPKSPKEVAESPEARDLNFFTGKPVPQNPIGKAGQFGEPESPEALKDWIAMLNGSERITAMTAVGMAQNLFSKLVDEELEKTS